MSIESMYATTTEEEHIHLCSMCGCTWKHVDDDCPGPMFRGYGPYDPYYDCPTCREDVWLT